MKFEFVAYDKRPSWHVTNIGKLGQPKKLGRIVLEGLKFIFLRNSGEYITKDERIEIEKKLIELNYVPTTITTKK